MVKGSDVRGTVVGMPLSLQAAYAAWGKGQVSVRQGFGKEA